MVRTKMTEQDKLDASQRTMGHEGKTLLQKKPRKKRRMKRVKGEIRRLQTGKNATKTLIPYEAVKRLVKEVVMDHSKQQGMRIQRTAIEALQQAGEAAMVQIMMDANKIARVAGNRNSVLIKDFQLARYIGNKHTMPK